MHSALPLQSRRLTPPTMQWNESSKLAYDIKIIHGDFNSQVLTEPVFRLRTSAPIASKKFRMTAEFELFK